MVGELRSCKPHGVAKKKKKDIVVAVVVQSLSRV